jgi:hypothetical protein
MVAGRRTGTVNALGEPTRRGDGHLARAHGDQHSPEHSFLAVPAGNVNKPAAIADSVNNSITGDIEVQVDFSMADYGPTTNGAQTLARKNATGSSHGSCRAGLAARCVGRPVPMEQPGTMRTRPPSGWLRWG